jgi:hypothetical protein
MKSRQSRDGRIIFKENSTHICHSWQKYWFCGCQASL